MSLQSISLERLELPNFDVAVRVATKMTAILSGRRP